MSQWDIYQAALGSTVVPGCQSNDFSLNEQELVSFADGLATPQFVAAHGVAPVLPFSTVRIDQLLTAMTSGGALLAARLFASPSNVVFYAQKRTESGRSTSADHERITLAKAVVSLDSINATDGQEAVGMASAHAAWDGTNPIVAFAQASLAAAATRGESYGVGPIKLALTSGTIWVPKVKSQSLSFGVSLTPDIGCGEGLPRTHLCNQVAPVGSITAEDATLPRLIGIFGDSEIAVTWYYRRKKTIDLYWADAAAKHIKITGYARISAQSISGSPRMDAVRCRFVDTGTLLTMAQDQAIT